MKRTALLVLASIFFSLLFNHCSKKNDMDEINKIIENVRKEFAPDNRVAIFDIEISETNNGLYLTGETNLSQSLNALIKSFDESGVIIKNNVKVLPSEELGEKIYGIINVSVANLRAAPKHPAELVTQSLLGTCVNILKKQNSWYLIQTPDKYIAWVDDDGIVPVSKTELDTWKTTDKIFVKEIYSHSYLEDRQSIVSDLTLGNILKKIGVNQKYFEVEYPDKRKALVRKNDAIEFKIWAANSKANPENIINTAKKFMGVPYLWGGTSTKGVDCSGFTKTVFYANGVIIPRDASQQVNVGELIDTEKNFDNLEPGDLLFFGDKATNDKKEKITHVALYIGDGKYIHASGMVKINSLKQNDDLYNDYRFNTFIRAKRIIGEYCSGENLVKNNSYYVNQDSFISE